MLSLPSSYILELNVINYFNQVLNKEHEVMHGVNNLACKRAINVDKKIHKFNSSSDLS